MHGVHVGLHEGASHWSEDAGPVEVLLWLSSSLLWMHSFHFPYSGPHAVGNDRASPPALGGDDESVGRGSYCNPLPDGMATRPSNKVLIDAIRVKCSQWERPNLPKWKGPERLALLQQALSKGKVSLLLSLYKRKVWETHPTLKKRKGPTITRKVVSSWLVLK